jgi:hypothetical protein
MPARAPVDEPPPFPEGSVQRYLVSVTSAWPSWEAMFFRCLNG